MSGRIERKTWGVCVALWLFAAQAGAQISFSVCVKDQLTSAPLAAAKIRMGKTGLLRTTDSSGCLTILHAGAARELNVFAEHENYRTAKLSFFLRSDTSFTIFLEPRVQEMGPVVVTAPKDNPFGISRMSNVDGTGIYAGKKSEVLLLSDLDANLAANSARQVFSKIAGLNIFENDGSGVQLGIGGRGLNPNRVSNFNTRQNGYDISADALGYPESYYTPPSEAVERIEILRGAASLQYGTQFGGMINFRFREPDTVKLRVLTRQSAGSFGFFNSFNSFSGTLGKFKYFTYYQYKRADGWRPNSQFDLHSGHAMLQYSSGKHLDVRAEYTHQSYLAKQPGGMTDRQFTFDPSQSYRSRNWFRVDWNLAALTLDYRISDRARLNWRSFGLLAGREALGFLGRPDRADDTTSFRDLLSDRYKNAGSELRFLQRYMTGKKNAVFLAGARAYFGHTDRKQGLADKTDQPNFAYLHPEALEHSAYLFPSRNVALFAENIFQLTPKLSLTPGLRYEHIRTASEGYYREEYRDLAGNVLYSETVEENRVSVRRFLLGGIGAQWKPSEKLELYANISQNYRSINFNDMRVVNPNFRVDPNLRDESGYTADAGIRYVLKDLLYADASVFYLRYNDRIGTVVLQDSVNYTLYRFRTNISDSRNIGVEAVAELDWMRLFCKESKHRLSTFVNASYIDAQYVSSEQNGFDGKKVELVPQSIFRSGLTYRFKEFSFTAQHAYTSEQFTDATNAVSTPSAIYGLIPAYSVMDVSARWGWKLLTLSAGVNNVLNEMYFTRRADGYPGPGILPSDPRNYWVTLQARF